MRCSIVIHQYEIIEETIEHMDWPAKSPDLNPIEHGWDILQHRISNRQNQPNSLQELSDALVDEWSRITQQRSKTITLNFRIFEKIYQKSYEAIEMSQNVNNLSINIEYVHLAHE
jgi:hypothetical protein